MTTVVGLLGIIGLNSMAASFRARKDGGEDRRTKPKWKLRFLGLGLIVIAMILGATAM